MIERMSEAFVLGVSGKQKALPQLQRMLLDDSSTRVREAAACALLSMKDEVSNELLVDLLLQGLDSTLESTLLCRILKCLQTFQNSRLELTYVAYTHHDDLEVARAAMTGLFFCARAEGVELAREMLGHADAKIRRLSVHILERRGDASDLERLFPMLGDSDLRVIQSVRMALRRLRNGTRVQRRRGAMIF
jgi:HEAT repeat protein